MEDYNVESAVFAILQMNEVKRISKYTEFVFDVSVHCQQQFNRGSSSSS